MEQGSYEIEPNKERLLIADNHNALSLQDHFMRLPSPPLPAWAAALAFGTAILLIGVVVDVLFHRHSSFWATIGGSDVLTALIATVLFYHLLRQQRRRRKEVQHRIGIIADTNHHVRNAMEVITLSAASSLDRAHMEMINESVMRIDWALREILPKL